MANSETRKPIAHAVVEQESSAWFSEQSYTSEQLHFIRNNTIVINAAPWLPVPHELRKYGGIENVLEGLIAELDAAGAKKIIVLGHPGNKLLEEKYKSVLAVTPLEMSPDVDYLEILRTNPRAARDFERKYNHAGYQWVLDYHNAGNEVGVIHDHTNIGMRFGSFVNKKIPVVVTTHNALVTPYATEQTQHELERYKDIKRFGFIAISQDQMSQMPELNWLRVVYNGLDINKFREAKKKIDQEPYLLFVGRVTRDKGVHNAIRIAKLLDMKLIIAGAVEETEEAQQYYQDEIAPHLHKEGKIMHFKDGVNGQQKIDLFTNATCFLMPVEWPEPFGMVMIEAFAADTPVVGFRRGSIPEIIGEGTGYIAENIFGAVASIKRILHGEIQPRRCREWVKTLFSSKRMTANYINAYMQQAEAVRFPQEKSDTTDLE